MATKITSDILESYLHCQFKGYLKLAGQQGTRGDFAAMLTELRPQSGSRPSTRSSLDTQGIRSPGTFLSRPPA